MPAEISITFRSKDLTAERRKRIARAIAKATLTAEATAHDLIENTPKTGRLYKRGERAHQASAPGEAPATDTGGLVGSLHSEISPMEGTFAASKVYAEPLEFGTLDGKLAPRPFMRPAFEAGKKVLREELNK